MMTIVVIMMMVVVMMYKSCSMKSLLTKKGLKVAISRLKKR